MKKGWISEVLKEATHFKSGKTVSKTIEKEFGEILYTKVGDMNLEGNEEFITTSTRYVDKKDINENQIIPLGAVIFPKRGGAIATNKKRRIIKPTIVDLNTMAVTPSDKLNSDYLYYWFESIDLQELSNGTSIPQINNTSFDNVYISYPQSLQEQQQIVAILDEAFEAIDQAKANIEKNIENAKELFQSKLNEIFSGSALSGAEGKGEDWEEKMLGEIGKVSMCKRILKKQTSPTGDIPFYKIGTFGKKPNAFIDKEIYKEFKEKYPFPKKGDILISASGTIGRRVIYNGEPAYFQDSNIVWIDNNEDLVLNEYLYQFYGICDWNPSKGATISRLYNDDLRRIKISFPNTLEQKKLVKNMVALNIQTKRIFHHYRKKMENLEELKKSILQKAFSGELTNKEPVV
ncbi:restriction endonuclease subunit S [Maribacter litopenaei]|uniref:Restriction endonuclease subunit S n=1 Tax=Maribacter litopenaei TaxID=2976127 RepID=A0ABY5Y796_9FLAO|nr:restriction endonuclease subunit S [Maribacter litopenaei]UWX54897.1 restriction endonuclease subunit S [Maribacter litopenaei]